MVRVSPWRSIQADDTDSKPCHALRKEFGSYVATCFSLFLAQKLLGPKSGCLCGAMSPAGKRVAACALALGIAFVAFARAAPDATQVVPLTAGWNLISMQVGTSYTPAQFQGAMSRPDYLQQIWGYNPTGNPATPGSWDTFQPLAPPEFPSDVNELVPGKAYWVKVSQSTAVTLVAPPWNGSVQPRHCWLPPEPKCCGAILAATTTTRSSSSE